MTGGRMTLGISGRFLRDFAERSFDFSGYYALFEDLVGGTGFEVLETGTGSYGIAFKLMERDSGRYGVAKMPLPSEWTDQYGIQRSYTDKVDHILRDSHALQVAAGVNHVVQQIDIFKYPLAEIPGVHALFPDVDGNKNFPLLIREHAEGNTLRRLGLEQLPEHGRPRPLEYAVRELHRRGMASLELYPKNVVVDTNGFPGLFDLGSAIFEEDLNEEQFGRYKAEDLKDLARITGRPMPDFGD